MNVKAQILDFKDEIKRRITLRHHYDYRLSFNKAIENTRDFGLDVPTMSFDEGFSSRKNDTVRQEIKEIIYNNIHQYPIELLAGNCFYFAEMAQVSLKRELNINSVFTLGSYSDKGVRLFYESLSKLKYRIRDKGYSSAGIQLHAWLTLPDYGVIDVTIIPLLQLLGVHSVTKDEYLYYLDTSKQKRSEGFSYHPILVGSEYLRSINLKPILHAVINQ